MASFRETGPQAVGGAGRECPDWCARGLEWVQSREANLRDYEANSAPASKSGRSALDLVSHYEVTAVGPEEGETLS